MHYPELNISIRRRLDDAAARSFQTYDVGEALDEAAKFIQGEIGVLKNRTSLSLVANKREYDVASTVQKPEMVYYYDTGIPREVTLVERHLFQNLARVPTSGTIPRWAYFDESDRTLSLAPMPDTAAGADQLNGAVNATVTTFTLDATTNFPDEGRGIIESEVFSWTGKTSTTLTGITRGMEGTTAAIHADNTAVTERDILIYSQRVYADREMWRYYITGTATATVSSTAVSGSSTAWANNVVAGDYFGMVGASTVSATATPALQWYKISSVTDDTNIVLASNFLQPTVTGGSYIIGSPNPFPSYLDPVLKAYAVSTMLKKAGMFDRSRIEWATVERAVKNAKKNQHQGGVMIVSGSMYDENRSGRMPITMGDQTVY